METAETAEAGGIVYDAVVPPGQPWSRVVRSGEVLRIVDIEGQQAVDFLCFDADDTSDRYNAMNTVKVQGNVYVGLGTVLFSDRVEPMMTVVADSIGRHDTLYGCCSNANNQRRYGVTTSASCYTNFETELARNGIGRSGIVSNVNFFMQVPVLPDGTAGIAADVSPPGSFVDLRAERDILAVISNCPQVHNPCNGYNPSPVRVTIISSASGAKGGAA